MNQILQTMTKNEKGTKLIV